MFYAARELNLTLNGRTIYANSAALSQQANLISPYQADEPTNTRSTPEGPVRNSLSISYFLTGADYLRDLIYTNHKIALTGNFAGLIFTQGYLQGYSVNAQPNSPVAIQANILIADEISGQFTSNNSITPPNNLVTWSFNDAEIYNSNFSSFTIDDISSFSWDYKANITPIYYYKQTGESSINPDRISFGEKEISCTIVSDDTNLPLRFTGENFALTLALYNPAKTVGQLYDISGKINQKDFSINDTNLSESRYTITQAHINEEPKIASVTTATYPSLGYITIQSPNLTNGYYSNNNSFPLVERVILADRDLRFNTARGAVDTITGYIPADVINGTLQVQTAKGLIVYPTTISLNYSGINVSGFSPLTGNYHDRIIISGSNFFRISHVLFNGIPTTFNVYNTTGNVHQLIANVPDNATIGNITVLSSLRNISGISTGVFIPISEITGFTPATGEWGSRIEIYGKNFTGISNVYFNNIPSPSFSVTNNSKIIAFVPGTGRNTKGYLKVSGFNGMEGYSKTIYYPIVRISGISSISGGIDGDFRITGCFDSGLLCFTGGGFKVSFGNVDAVFYKNNDYVLTGILPSGFYDDRFIALYEPDGVTKYPIFTGRFQQVGPAPIIETINGGSFYNIKPYTSETLNLGGQYFKDFFGLQTYVLISGTGSQYRYSNINYNSLGTQLSIPNVMLTGATGMFDIYVINFAGTGVFKASVNNTAIPPVKTGLFRPAAIDLIPSASLTFSPTLRAGTRVYVNTALGTSFGDVGYLQDKNPTTFSCTPFFPKPTETAAGYYTVQAPNTSNSGWVMATFPAPITLSYIFVEQNSNIPTDAAPNSVSSIYMADTSTSRIVRIHDEPSPGNVLLATTGMLHVFDNNNNIVYATGINFANATHILTGTLQNVRRIKLSRTGPPTRYLSFSTIVAI